MCTIDRQAWDHWWAQVESMEAEWPRGEVKQKGVVIGRGIVEGIVAGTAVQDGRPLCTCKANEVSLANPLRLPWRPKTPMHK